MILLATMIKIILSILLTIPLEILLAILLKIQMAILVSIQVATTLRLPQYEHWAMYDEWLRWDWAAIIKIDFTKWVLVEEDVNNSLSSNYTSTSLQPDLKRFWISRAWATIRTHLSKIWFYQHHQIESFNNSLNFSLNVYRVALDIWMVSILIIPTHCIGAGVVH